MDEGNIAMAIVNSPVNLFGVSLCALLLAASLYVLRSWLRSSKLEQNEEKRKLLPRMKNRDFYVGDLTPFNGIDNERILIGVNFKVFDVTNRGRDFYGPDGPYHCFAGKDASRGLATMSLESSTKEDFDDLKDLSSSELDQLNEWEMQFKGKYEYVGRLLGPNEKPKDYSETEESSGIPE
ncbi:membrane-associated progesterone receptor component 1-like [Symsagittifera roscoffensis]|uniref:membrane-associated progesterone receptor component 1-like n=1 Tax=Symsagittifera roscoffensis TaxID=84072 RepID=UPI00307B7302